MKNLMTSVKNALGIRAATTEVRGPGTGGAACSMGGGSLWKWYLYHSM